MAVDDDEELTPGQITRLIIAEYARESARLHERGAKPEDGEVSKRKMQKQIADLRIRVTDLETIVATMLHSSDKTQAPAS